MMEIEKEIQEKLFERQDVKYRDFQKKLIPTVEEKRVIGVRTPELRKLAKQLAKREDIGDFLSALPHPYFDEDQLHGFLISEEKDFDRCVEKLDSFLPFVDNWATCDQTSPKVFKKNREKLLPYIEKWLDSGHTYAVRFGIGMLMQHFLDDLYELKFPERVAAVRSEEYYINMMIAWYFATALAKQYDSILPFFEEKRLDKWTHNKAIQKAVESYRISPEQKKQLKALKLKK